MYKAIFRFKDIEKITETPQIREVVFFQYLKSQNVFEEIILLTPENIINLYGFSGIESTQLIKFKLTSQEKNTLYYDIENQ